MSFFLLVFLGRFLADVARYGLHIMRVNTTLSTALDTSSGKLSFWLFDTIFGDDELMEWTKVLIESGMLRIIFLRLNYYQLA